MTRAQLVSIIAVLSIPIAFSAGIVIAVDRAQGDTRVIENVSDARKHLREVIDAGGSCRVATIWSAPEGQPRHPVAYQITCYEERKP